MSNVLGYHNWKLLINITGWFRAHDDLRIELSEWVRFLKKSILALRESSKDNVAELKGNKSAAGGVRIFEHLQSSKNQRS